MVIAFGAICILDWVMRCAGPVRRGTVNHVRRGTEQHSADRRVRHSPPVRRVTESRRNEHGGFDGVLPLLRNVDMVPHSAFCNYTSAK